MMKERTVVFSCLCFGYQKKYQALKPQKVHQQYFDRLTMLICLGVEVLQDIKVLS